jgi:hypothetical protein
MQRLSFFALSLCLCLVGCNTKPATPPIASAPAPKTTPPAPKTEVFPYQKGFVGRRGIDTHSALVFKNEREYVEYDSLHNGREVERAKGTYQYADGILTLSKKDRWREDTFYVVNWAESVFLIDAPLMPNFCSNVAYFHDSFMRRMCYSDERNPRDPQPLKGLPEVPEVFRPLLKTPLTARITRIENGRYFLDKGRKHGVVLNTKFRGKAVYCYPPIARKVGEETTECTAEQTDRKQVKPAVGTVVYLGGFF